MKLANEVLKNAIVNVFTSAMTNNNSDLICDVVVNALLNSESIDEEDEWFVTSLFLLDKNLSNYDRNKMSFMSICNNDLNRLLELMSVLRDEIEADINVVCDENDEDAIKASQMNAIIDAINVFV